MSTVLTPLPNFGPKFSLGQLVATPAALAAMVSAEDSAENYLRRHLNGDWGDCGEEDSKANDFALKAGDERLLSVYHLKDKTKIWIITEADRSSTCVQLPSDY